jgi:hypothetical protein
VAATGSEVLVGMQFHELKKQIAERTAALRAGCLCVECHATRRAEPPRRGIAGLGGIGVNVVAESDEQGGLQVVRQSHSTGYAGQLGADTLHWLGALGAEELVGFYTHRRCLQREHTRDDRHRELVIRDRSCAHRPVSAWKHHGRGSTYT